jgi:putative endonuclease
MNKGWMYILECADGSYYTGSTNNLELRLAQHQAGEGANHTKKHLPVKLVYFEEYERIDQAFYREKQVQGWNRKKKEALINGMPQKLHELAECMNETHYKNYSNGGFGSAQPPQPPQSPQSPRSLSEAEGSEVEGSTTHKQAEGR